MVDWAKAPTNKQTLSLVTISCANLFVPTIKKRWNSILIISCTKNKPEKFSLFSAHKASASMAVINWEQHTSLQIQQQYRALAHRVICLSLIWHRQHKLKTGCSSSLFVHSILSDFCWNHISYYCILMLRLSPSQEEFTVDSSECVQMSVSMNQFSVVVVFLSWPRLLFVWLNFLLVSMLLVSTNVG